MKKLLLVLTVCAFFVACNNGSGTNADVNKDTTTTTVSHDSTIITPTDTTKHVADTTIKMTTTDTTHH
jgi:hypothetical protein